MCGCGGDGEIPSGDARQAAQASLDEGSKLFESGDYAAAEKALAAAMSGPLRADTFVQAGRYRAQSLAYLGNKDQAFAVLDEIRQGLASDAEYHVQRGLVYRAIDDERSARAEFADARKIDRTIKIPAN